MYAHTHIEETGDSILKNDEMPELEQDVCSPGQSPVLQMREEACGDGHRQMILSSTILCHNSQRMLILEAKRVQEELTQTVAWVSSYLARFIDQCCLPHIPPTSVPQKGKEVEKRKRNEQS